jgi:putative membrane protein
MATNHCVLASTAAGAAGGIAGALAMNGFQALWSAASASLAEQQGHKPQQSESQDDDATKKTADVISQAVSGHKLTKPEKEKAGPAVHFGIGTLMGAVYGVAAETLPISRVGRGTIYGGAVWLFADEIAVPAFGLSGSPAETPLSTHLNALASHLVYGFVTDLVRRTLLRVAAD